MLYPMYEQNWLYQIANWSRNQESYITQLQNQDGESQASTSLEEWKEQFSQLRERAEQNTNDWARGSSPQPNFSAHYLLQQFDHLYDSFYRFLQDSMANAPAQQQAQRATSTVTAHDMRSESEYKTGMPPEKGKEVKEGKEAKEEKPLKEEIQEKEEKPAKEKKYVKEEEGKKYVKEEKQRENTHPVPIGGHHLPPLPYPYNALEPYIDEKTMRLHHDKHHLAYVEGLNKAEKAMQKARQSGDYSLIKHWEREAAFNGAGHYLHTIFWNIMTPKGGGKATGPIAEEINRTFGSYQKFKDQFSNAAEKVEGGGWAMLIWAPRSHRVEILQAEKHQNLSQQDMIPLLVLDVWEHAYYLKYNNKREDYVEAWWNVVNWDTVNDRYLQACKVKWHPY